MSALPIDPSTHELMRVVLGKMPRLTPNEQRAALFQAGVEAERARAAAEATEEWGVRYYDGSILGSPDREHAEARVRWDTTGRTLIRRTVGPWEVAS